MDKRLFVGVDLGGTNIKAAVVNTDTGELSGTRSTSTRGRDGHDAVIAGMAKLIADVITDAAVDPSSVGGVGVGVPGLLDLERGMTLFLPNLPGQWRNVPLCAQLSELSGLKVAALNDARSMTLAEWKLGAGRGVDTVACYTLGTGIGGGLVINGQLYLGIGGAAGELGHVCVDVNGPKCGCGSYGCIEAYASGPAIAAAGMKAVAQGMTTQIAALAENDLNRITPELICRAALEGDAVAKEIYEHAGAMIGAGIANVVTTITPRRVIIGGGVMQAGELLLEPIRRTVRARVGLAQVDQVEIVPAELGNLAGLIGAALWARSRVGG